MQNELTGVPEHALCVVPEAVEAQDFAVVVQELLQRVAPLIRTKGLHTLLNLDGGPWEIQIINTYYHTSIRCLRLVIISYRQYVETFRWLNDYLIQKI